LFLDKEKCSINDLRLNGHTSFEFQTRNNTTCFGHICNHSHGQENHTQKYIINRDAFRPCSRDSSGDLEQWHIQIFKNPRLKLCFNQLVNNAEYKIWSKS